MTLIESALMQASGYDEVASNGGFFRLPPTVLRVHRGAPLNKPIVGMAYDPATGGYRQVASDCGMFASNAPFQ